MSDNSAEQIRRRMEEVRSRLGADVEEALDSAKQLADWRTYVRRYPWACMAAAAAFGYFIVPRRLELNSPDADTLLKLARNNKLVVKANPSPRERRGAADRILGFAAQAAVRGALAYVGQRLGQVGGRQDGTEQS